MSTRPDSRDLAQYPSGLPEAERVIGETEEAITAASVRGFVPTTETHDRRVTKEQVEMLFQAWQDFPPEARAVHYSYLAMLAAQPNGIMKLDDADVFLLGWAPKDRQATEAVADGKGMMTESWYTNNVDFGGSQKAAISQLQSDFGMESPEGNPWNWVQGMAEKRNPYGYGFTPQWKRDDYRWGLLDQIALEPRKGKFRSGGETVMDVSDQIFIGTAILGGLTTAAWMGMAVAPTIAPAVVAAAQTAARAPVGRNIVAQFQAGYQLTKAVQVTNPGLMSATSVAQRAGLRIDQVIANSASRANALGKTIDFLAGTPNKRRLITYTGGSMFLAGLAGLSGYIAPDAVEDAILDAEGRLERERYVREFTGEAEEDEIKQQKAIAAYERKQRFGTPTEIEERRAAAEKNVESWATFVRIGNDIVAEVASRMLATETIRAWEVQQGGDVESDIDNMEVTLEPTTTTVVATSGDGEETVEIDNPLGITGVSDEVQQIWGYSNMTADELAHQAFEPREPETDRERAMEQAVEDYVGFADFHFYDPETDGTKAELNARGFDIVADPSSQHDPVRQIVFNMTQGTEGLDAIYQRIYAEKVEEREQEEDPGWMGGLPDDYKATSWILDERIGQGIPMYGNQPEGLDSIDYYMMNRSAGRPSGAFGEDVAPSYLEGAIFDIMANTSTPDVFAFQTYASQAGMYGSAGRPTIPGVWTPVDQQILAGAMIQTNVSGKYTNYMEVMAAYAKQGLLGQRLDQSSFRPEGPSQGPLTIDKGPFSVPAALREVPGPKSLADEVRQRFEDKLGRKPRQSELDAIAQELGGYYEVSNRERITLAEDAWYDRNRGLLSEGEMQQIEDPGRATSEDITVKYANEIDLNTRREGNSDSMRKILSATMGGRPAGIGSVSPAVNLQPLQRREF